MRLYGSGRSQKSPLNHGTTGPQPLFDAIVSVAQKANGCEQLSYSYGVPLTSFGAIRIARFLGAVAHCRETSDGVQVWGGPSDGAQVDEAATVA